MNTIEVCLSPALYTYKATNENFVVVIIDVLRATSAFCAAFDAGVESIIPVAGLNELLEYKNIGYLVAAEREGEKVAFADYGNSPTLFLKNNLTGKELAYSTTNGTQAVEIAKKCENIISASFTNLNAVSSWLCIQDKNVVILCSGWKNTFSLEDTLCAGALVETLELSGLFVNTCDASETALSIWKLSKNNLPEVVKKANHYQRLLALNLDDDLHHCFILNSSKALPVWDGSAFKNLSVR